MGVKLRERPGKGWYVLIDWQGKRKAKFFGTNKKLANDFADKLTAKLKWAEQNGEAVSLNSSQNKLPTVQEYFTDWLTTYANAHCKPSTAKDYRQALERHIFPSFGPQPLNEVTRIDVKRLIASLVTKKLKKQTIHNILTPFKEGYHHAIDDGVVSLNPVSNMGRLIKVKEDCRSHISPLTTQEVQALLQSTQTVLPSFYPLLLCALRTGMREGELLGLQWGDIDFQNRFIEVRRGIVRTQVSSTKTHKIRRIDMSPQLLQTLRQLKETRMLEASYRKVPMPDWVFVWPESFERMSDTTVRRLFYKALEKAEMRRVRLHDCRHTFASLLIQQKANPKYIQEQLGHGSIKVTMDIYGHLFEGDHRHFVCCLDDPKGTESATQPQPALEGTQTVNL
jgi:integrase